MSQLAGLPVLIEYVSFVKRRIQPLLSNEEIRQYSPGCLPPLSTMSRNSYPWVHWTRRVVDNVTSLSEGSVLDAIIAQALFGRARMMEQKWFQDVHRLHGSCLDSLPKDAPIEFAQSQAAIFGGTGRSEPPPPPTETTPTETTPTETTLTETQPTQDLLARLQAKIEEINTFETQQHKNLEDLFSALAKSYPGIKGVLCGVRHSFRGRHDRCAEREVLLSATSEYIQEMECQGQI
ncbi:hypothetical protein CCM_07827 [Cordyceps militaris CM01]|uniref:Uncharacterized protein n=1 Tax=Cordyceps militaris (strain CM01) TaxID=983644 RepID=G3JNW5_CORMM|nr:uncharacterized protein CCM_07827 [Cordyceps militaris CM01]EGX89575.1 hypothetical protein CCM_07827 [Cordyceps militaris CM01]